MTRTSPCQAVPTSFKQYFRAGRIDEFELHVAPAFLGDGVRLLDRLGVEPMKLERTRWSRTHLRYRVVK